MKIAITGANGFLGWHMRCAAFAQGITCVPIDRALMYDTDKLVDAIKDVDAVVHCAGVNRGTDGEVINGNLDPAQRLADAIERIDRSPRIVYANSIHCRANTSYGRAKRRVADIFSDAPGLSVSFSDVVLPNLFGEHGRPHYNSFVATFCHETAAGREPSVSQDREIPLMHVQDAAELLIEEAGASGQRCVEPKAEPIEISTVRKLLIDFAAVYQHGELPDLTENFLVKLFNTYRSYLFPNRYPIQLVPRTDQRGTLVECMRTAYAGGQAFVSSTVPEAVRGEHVHLRKFERFVVVSGEAEIAVRRLFATRVVKFRVNGAEPVAIDMPTMWAHSLRAVGDEPVTGFFWSNELFSPEDPDTFACSVAGSPEIA